MSIFRIVNRQRVPRLSVAIVPIAVLLLIIAVIGVAVGAARISDYTVYSLLAAALVAAGIGFSRGYISRRSLAVGVRRGVMKIADSAGAGVFGRDIHHMGDVGRGADDA